MRNRIAKDIIIDENGWAYMEEVLKLNRMIFQEARLLNRMDHQPLLFYTAHCNGELAGFKMGYGLTREIFYSAKGATSPLYRRRGVATRLLLDMMSKASSLGFREFHFDTFPVKFPGMVALGLKHGFQIKRLHWNREYHDYQVRMSRPIK